MLTTASTSAPTTQSPVGPMLERAANLSHDAWLLGVVGQKLESVQLQVSSREGKSAATSCSGFIDLVTECKFCYLFYLAS